MNKDVLSDSNNMLDAIDTIVHELRHGFQHEACQKPGFCGISEIQAKEWRDNFSCYITPTVNMIAYYNQPVEKDARIFAEKVINSLMEENNARF